MVLDGTARRSGLEKIKGEDRVKQAMGKILQGIFEIRDTISLAV